jgi:hypothetical protein
MEESEDVQQPQNHGNDHNTIEDGLDGSLHRNKAIHEPQENTHYDENFQELN